MQEPVRKSDTGDKSSGCLRANGSFEVLFRVESLIDTRRFKWIGKDVIYPLIPSVFFIYRLMYRRLSFNE